MAITLSEKLRRGLKKFGAKTIPTASKKTEAFEIDLPYEYRDLATGETRQLVYHYFVYLGKHGSLRWATTNNILKSIPVAYTFYARILVLGGGK